MIYCQCPGKSEKQGDPERVADFQLHCGLFFFLFFLIKARDCVLLTAIGDSTNLTLWCNAEPECRREAQRARAAPWKYVCVLACVSEGL